MNQDRWQEIENLYHAAQELPAADRASYLEKACAGDSELLEEVSSLLAEAEQPDDFLSHPKLTLGLSLLGSEQYTPLRSGQIGPYTIIKQLGRGGMGEVYLAKDHRLERMVALKLLPAFLSNHNLNVLRFEQEARAASGISHPNVAHIYEIGEAEGHRYIAMEYVEGDSLRALLGNKSLRLGAALEIALQVANALDAAHAAGIVHRDVKPENIIIRHDGLVKVVDFGLAKLTEPQRESFNRVSHQTKLGARVTRTVHTESGVIMGTANYMSPEQARGQEIDARTDIWSWGVVLYEMLAGQPPFTGATNSDVIAEILKSDPPPLQTALSHSIKVILQKSLSKDKNDRYASMPELILDLRDLLRHFEGDRLLHLNLPLDQMNSIADEPTTEEPYRAFSSVNRLLNIVRRHYQPFDNGGGLITEPPRIADTDGASKPVPAKSLTGVAIKPAWSAPLFTGLGVVLAVALAFVIYSFVGRNTTQRGDTIASPQITHLTTNGRTMDAAISGDARLLAYVPVESGKQSLWIQDLGSGEKWQLLPPDPALCWGLRFAPNGQSLFYITTQPSSTISVLYRIPVRGGPSHKLVVNLDAPPAVSPDGMQIAFVRSYPAQHRDALFIANVDGSAEREIAARQHPDRFSFSGASWSPDSKLIALGAGRGDENKFAVVGVSVTGNELVELTPWQWADVEGVAWDSDGHTLVFSARALGSRSFQLWRLSYPNREMHLITNDQNSYQEATLAQSEDTLVASRTYEVSNIWAVSSAGAPRRLTTEGQEGADGLAVTPAGRIVYTVGEHDQSILWSMNMEGGDRRPLIENTGFLPSVSRDGRFIAYVSTEQGTRHIWLMDADGRNNRQLTTGLGENYPSVTPDGNWVIYTSLAKERGTLWKIPTGGGQPVQLTHDGITIRPVVSPDGTKIACTYRMDETDRWKIAVLPIDGGVPYRTFALPYPYNQIIRWTSDSQALIYLDKHNGAHNLWRQPLDGSAPKQITNFNEELIQHHDGLSPETELVLARGGRKRDIILIKNFK